MEKNEKRVGVVLKLGANGEGILKEDEYTVFVPYCLPGEKISYKVLKVKGNVAFGKLLEVHTPSEDRVVPKCKVFEKCGGCQLQHLTYEKQLRLKGKIVKDCLSKIAFTDFDVPDAAASDAEYGYRNKLQLPVRAEGLGFSIGFFANNSHRIIPLDDCPIQPDWCAKIISVVKEYMLETGVAAYDEESSDGLIRHVVVREINGELLVTIVANGNELPRDKILIDLLKENFESFSLFLNVNENRNNVILGDKFIRLYGKEKVTATDLGIKYETGPSSFLQVNDSVRRKIYEDALKKAETDGNTVVIDAYSGAGMLTAIFAKRCKKAIGIEVVKEAVQCADDLKEFNGLSDRMENVCARCEEKLPEIMREVKKTGDRSVLVLDPPRQGVDETLIEAIIESEPDRIIYISCSPQTLARDLGLLTGTLKREGVLLVKNSEPSGKYKIESVQPYDMFPQTKHVETLVCLSRKTNQSDINS